jgi:hypothetical protein
MEQIGLPQAAMECGGGGSRVEIDRFFEKTAGKVFEPVSQLFSRFFEISRKPSPLATRPSLHV